jgi:hypothetical protein
MGENEGGALVLLDGEVFMGEAREEGRCRGRAARPWGSRPAGGRGRARRVGPACQLLGGARGFGPRGPEEGKRATREEEKKEVGRGSRWVGGGLGRLDRFVFFFFSFSFSNPFLNQFQTFLNSNLLHLFKFKFLTQISPTIFKTFHKPFLTTFQTYFKFKPLHKFSQTISQLFLRTFSQIF